MTRLLPLLALLAPPALAQTAPDIPGRWVSAAAEAAGPVTGMRDFTFDGDRWSVRFSAFADAGTTQPLFVLDVAGAYVVGGPSAAVPGAWDANFPILSTTVTAASPAGVDMFAGMGCTLSEGEPKALIAEGCGFLPPVMDAMGEFDLVALKDGQLFLGDRSGDLTKARPTALIAYPLVRK
jgi:hypothetical protein